MIIKDEIKKNVVIAWIAVSTLFFVSSDVLSLEKMTKKELRSETAQAGLSIGMDNVVIYKDMDSLKIINPDDPENSYVGFENVKGLGTFATGYSDLDRNGKAQGIVIDICNLTYDPDTAEDDIPLVLISSPDWDQNMNMSIGNINWCGKNIGSLDITNFSLPSWHVFLGSFNGSGIRYQLGFRTNIEEVRFNYGTTGESFSVKNLQAAGTYDHDPADSVQDDPADPSTWKASGEFRVGETIADSPNPATIDVGVRESDGKAMVQMSLSASGSFRASEIKFGTQSFGPMAIDGIDIHSMKMELPGRGLGNITNP